MNTYFNKIKTKNYLFDNPYFYINILRFPLAIIYYWNRTWKIKILINVQDHIYLKYHQFVLVYPKEQS